MTRHRRAGGALLPALLLAAFSWPWSGRAAAGDEALFGNPPAREVIDRAGFDDFRSTTAEAARFGEWPSDFVAPLGTACEHWRHTLVLTGAVVGLVTVDPVVRDPLKEVGELETVATLADGFSFLGDRRTVMLLLAGMTAGSYLGHYPYLLRTSFQAVESALFAAAWVELGKTLSGRERPEAAGDDRGRFHGPNLSQPEKWKSFPSGHAGAAFAVGTVIARRYPGRPARLAYGLAGGVALSRVLKDRHWTSDAFLGSLVGWAAASAVVGDAMGPGRRSAAGARAWTLGAAPGGLSFSRTF